MDWQDSLIAAGADGGRRADDADAAVPGKCIQIPTPQFVIFYNGSQEQPDRKILRL